MSVSQTTIGTYFYDNTFIYKQTTVSTYWISEFAGYGWAADCTICGIMSNTTGNINIQQTFYCYTYGGGGDQYQLSVVGVDFGFPISTQLTAIQVKTYTSALTNSVIQGVANPVYTGITGGSNLRTFPTSMINNVATCRYVLLTNYYITTIGTNIIAKASNFVF